MSNQPPSLPPVPAPLRQRWREFRIQALPFVAFVFIGTLAGALWQQVVVPHQINTADPSHCRPSLDGIMSHDDSGKLDDPLHAGSRTNGIVDSYSPRD